MSTTCFQNLFLARKRCSRIGLAVVIVGMAFRRPYRIILTSALATTIALGGFYTGYAKADPRPKPTPQIPSPEYFGKVPPEIGFLVARNNASKLKLTPAELKKLKSEVDKILPEYFSTQKKTWEIEFRNAKELEEGKILNTFPGDVSGMLEFYEFQELDKASQLPQTKLEMAVFNILGQKRMRTLNQLRGSYPYDTSAQSLDIILNESQLEGLNLSQIQRNQLTMLTYYYVKQMKNPKIVFKQRVRLADALPTHEADLKFVLNADSRRKAFMFFNFRNRLTPVQRVELNTILRNKLYVQP